MAAVLHDVVVASPWTLDDPRAEDFASEVLDAVKALTKRPGETRMDAALRAARSPIARAIKLADNTEIMNLDRISERGAEVPSTRLLANHRVHPTI